jgi:hypothetical protein
MSFKKFIETRFADPITAIDISSHHIIYGSAMGRLGIYEIKNDKEMIFLEALPELVRGVRQIDDPNRSHIQKKETSSTSVLGMWNAT